MEKSLPGQPAADSLPRRLLGPALVNPLGSQLGHVTA